MLTTTNIIIIDQETQESKINVIYWPKVCKRKSVNEIELH